MLKIVRLPIPPDSSPIVRRPLVKLCCKLLMSKGRIIFLTHKLWVPHRVHWKLWLSRWSLWPHHRQVWPIHRHFSLRNRLMRSNYHTLRFIHLNSNFNESALDTRFFDEIIGRFALTYRWLKYLQKMFNENFLSSCWYGRFIWSKGH